MSDRNKTELTQNITRNVALWLDGKGFKPVETEVGVARGWVADVAGVCWPTQTEMINLKLIRRPPRWNSSGGGEAYHVARAAWDIEHDSIPQLLTALVEVKTSVADYRGDRKWSVPTWPANLCYVAMPEKMIADDAWPMGWGVILFSQNGATVRRVFPPKMQPVAAEQQLNLVVSLAVARDHTTRHARLREWQKEVRIQDGERKTVSRVADTIRAVRDVMRGETVERALLMHGIRAKLPETVLQDLRTLQPRGTATEAAI